MKNKEEKAYWTHDVSLFDDRYLFKYGYEPIIVVEKGNLIPMIKFLNK